MSADEVVQLGLELDDDLVLLGRVMAVVRERHGAAVVVERRWQQATRDRAAAAELEVDAVRVCRDLLAALTNSAGVDGLVDLTDARTAALTVLDAEAGP
jgi:acetolactate synthase regulatory subunit